MTLLRHPDQVIHTQGWHEEPPPPGWAEAAYELGLEPGSGVVHLRREAGGHTTGTLRARVRGVHVHLRALGADHQRAAANLLDQLRRLAP